MIGDYRTIIFVDGHSIKTTNTKSVKLVAGSANQSGYRDASGKDARFDTIPSFVQLDGNNIVAVDQGNHCLRLITLDGKVTKRYSGVCTEAGRNRDRKYQKPTSVIIDNQRFGRMLLLIDQDNDAIIQINTKSKTSNIFYQFSKSWGMKPYMMTQHSRSGDLYITTNSLMIVKVTYKSKNKLQYISGGRKGFLDGSFHDGHHQKPTGILLINRGNTILVADELNGSIRVLDLCTNTTRSICSDDNGLFNGAFEDVCGLNYPHSFVVNGTDLLIGEAKRITKIKGQ